jgi:hypothetical protein
MDERAAEVFRQRIVASQPWFPQAQALAEIDRLAALSDKARAQARLVLAGMAACLAMPRVDLQRASGRL